MKNYFLDLVKIIKRAVDGSENFTAWFSGETLDFARFTQAKIRQAGTVKQQYIDIDLIKGLKHASVTIGLSKDIKTDEQTIVAGIKKLREQLTHSQDDPFLMVSEGHQSSESSDKSTTLDSLAITNEILELASGLDFVGCYFGGPIYKGFANSFGQLNWFQKTSLVIDTSIYNADDRATKQSYADVSFDKDVFREKIETAKSDLKLLQKAPLTIDPGHYRVYFSPAAVHELLGTLNWGGFSRKSLEVKNSPLMPLYNRQKELSRLFSLRENIAKGVGPNFQAQGFMKPACTTIIDKGQLVNTLISPKTAKEYGLDHNGASEDEAMCSMELDPGELLDSDILKTLGDGLYINNLWYLNFSDRQNGCLTGMTRFLCYVVKDGQPVAPFSVMRFDDSIYRIFGDNLLHVTKDRHMIIDTTTYDERATACALLPGVIAENVRFTL